VNRSDLTNVLEIFKAGLDSVDPFLLTRKSVHFIPPDLTFSSSIQNLSKTFKPDNFSKINIIGFGKASALMAASLEKILPNIIRNGHIIVKYGINATVTRIPCTNAGHPIPDIKGLKATRKITKILEKSTSQDLIICLISGGGSSLFVQPVSEITLEQIKAMNAVLISCGADIHEINTLRKHVSAVKGGRLCEKAFPAAVVTLILSDVIGDSLDTIASGPTTPDPTTFDNCLQVIDKYNIRVSIPGRIFDYLARGANGEFPETPKPGNPVFEKVTNLLIGNNGIAINVCKNTGLNYKYDTRVLSSSVQGSVDLTAKMYADLARKTRLERKKTGKPICWIAGGETTVKIKGSGMGGRNQELCLRFAREMDDLSDIVFLSAGTDGNDGPTDAAGALIDGPGMKSVKRLNMDIDAYIDNNDSYHFFKNIDRLIKTGPTGTNVMDIQIMLVL
jgi:glycerate-2-kinase